jgi:hypothetical protein
VPGAMLIECPDCRLPIALINWLTLLTLVVVAGSIGASGGGSLPRITRQGVACFQTLQARNKSARAIGPMASHNRVRRRHLLLLFEGQAPIEFLALFWTFVKRPFDVPSLWRFSSADD